jgi:hypothetical protein
MTRTPKLPLRLLQLVAVVSLLTAASPCRAAEISVLLQRITLAEDGSGQAEVKVTLTAAAPGKVVVPLGAGDVQGLRADEQPGIAVTLEKSGGRPSLAIALERAFPQGETVAVHYTLPGYYEWNGQKRSDFGNHTLEYRFVNSQVLPIVAFTGEVLLPPSYLVNSVEDSIPELNEKTPVAPFQVMRADGRSGVRIRANKLRLGDTCMVQFRFKRDDKSPALLVVGIGLAAVYLFAFRDLVAGRRNNNAGAALAGSAPPTA